MPVGGRVEPPDHPLVFETLRDCLTEALDAEGMVGVLEAIEQGEIEVFGKDTLQPSAFSHQLLNAMPYAFLDDAPLEERRARAVTLRRALPEDSRDLGALSPDAIAEEEAYAWPAIRDADELHDALLSLGVLTGDDLAEHPDDAEAWCEWYASLAEAGRVRTLDAPRFPSPGVPSPSPSPLVGRGDQVEGRDSRLRGNDGEQRGNDGYTTCSLWYAVERAEVVRGAYEDGDIEAVAEMVRGRAESSGPFTVNGLAQRLALSESAVSQAAIRLEAEGVLLRGRFRPGATDEEFCDRRILARIHRSTIGRLRREIEPVPVASFIRFLLEWQHATPGTRLAGRRGAHRGRRAVAGVRGGCRCMGERAADEPVDRLPRLDARRADARRRAGLGAVREANGSATVRGAVPQRAGDAGGAGGRAVAAGRA